MGSTLTVLLLALKILPGMMKNVYYYRVKEAGLIYLKISWVIY